MDEIKQLKQTIKKLDGKNMTLLQSIEKLKKEVERFQHSERRLSEYNAILIEEVAAYRDLSLFKDAKHKKDQKKLVNALKKMEKKMAKYADAEKREKSWIKESKALTEKVAEVQKMLHHRQMVRDNEEAELIAKYENKIKQTRIDLDEKLYRMKERMKNMFADGATKTKETHDQEVLALKNYIRDLSQKLGDSDYSLTREIYNLNQQNILLKRENEFLKNKLQLAEDNKRESRSSAPINSSTLQLEDEVVDELSHIDLADSRSIHDDADDEATLRGESRSSTPSSSTLRGYSRSSTLPAPMPRGDARSSTSSASMLRWESRPSAPSSSTLGGYLRSSTLPAPMPRGDARSSTSSSSGLEEDRVPYRYNELPHRNYLIPFRNILIPHYLRMSSYATSPTYSFMRQDTQDTQDSQDKQDRKPKPSKRRTT